MKSRASSLLSYEFSLSGIIKVWDFALGAYSDMSFCLSSHEFSPIGAYSVMGFRLGLTKLSKISFSGLLKLSVTRVLSVCNFSRLGLSLSGPCNHTKSYIFTLWADKFLELPLLPPTPFQSQHCESERQFASLEPPCVISKNPFSQMRGDLGRFVKISFFHCERQCSRLGPFWHKRPRREH